MAGSKEKIIACTMKLMCEKGFAATSISDILASSGTGKGQFYYYFDSKKALGLAVIAAHVAHWEANCFQDILLDPERDDVSALWAMLDWILSDHEKQTHYFGCPVGNLIIELSTVDEDFRKPLEELYARWTDLIAKRLAGLGIENPKLQGQQLIAGQRQEVD